MSGVHPAEFLLAYSSCQDVLSLFFDLGEERLSLLLRIVEDLQFSGKITHPSVAAF